MYSELVGPVKYIKNFSTVANETYPVGYTQGVAITITGVSDAHTVTHTP